MNTSDKIYTHLFTHTQLSKNIYTTITIRVIGNPIKSFPANTIYNVRIFSTENIIINESDPNALVSDFLISLHMLIHNKNYTERDKNFLIYDRKEIIKNNNEILGEVSLDNYIKGFEFIVDNLLVNKLKI
jgi:hypothetical protein